MGIQLLAGWLLDFQKFLILKVRQNDVTSTKEGKDFVLSKMETGRQCVLCPRSILRQRRHIMQDTLPQNRPDLAEYIIQNGLIQVCTHFSIIIV